MDFKEIVAKLKELTSSTLGLQALIAFAAIPILLIYFLKIKLWKPKSLANPYSKRRYTKGRFRYRFRRKRRR